MPPLTDPVILGQFRAVLTNCKYTGYVTAKDVALEWIAAQRAPLLIQDLRGEATRQCHRRLYDQTSAPAKEMSAMRWRVRPVR